VVIGTDCIVSYKPNYHTIMTTMTPRIETAGKNKYWILAM